MIGWGRKAGPPLSSWDLLGLGLLGLGDGSRHPPKQRSHNAFHGIYYDFMCFFFGLATRPQPVAPGPFFGILPPNRPSFFPPRLRRSNAAQDSPAL